MLRTFNCGIGMVVVLDRVMADAASACFAKHGETVVKLGEIVAASGGERVSFRGRLDLRFQAA
jgi:phosphoribosylformylglycinamidine cyclo-ligase